MYDDDTKATRQAKESPVARFDYALTPWQSSVSPSNSRRNIKMGDGKKMADCSGTGSGWEGRDGWKH